MSQNKRSHNSWVGFVLILVGALFLLDTFHIMDFGGVITNWWPAIFIIIGIIKLQGYDRGAGLIFILIGTLFLLTTHDIIGWGSIWKFWPLVLIFIGLSMIFKGRRSSGKFTNDSTTGNDYIHSNAVFGGADHIITSQNFKGGETMALFGGVELDLRGAKISPDGCKIHVTALFGGVEMIIPNNWNIILTGTPIFGAIQSKSYSSTDAKIGNDVYIHCTVAFGAVEIK
jgi:predicted membrane protein